MLDGELPSIVESVLVFGEYLDDLRQEVPAVVKYKGAPRFELALCKVCKCLVQLQEVAAVGRIRYDQIDRVVGYLGDLCP
jgi:hypothetical protein